MKKLFIIISLLFLVGCGKTLNIANIETNLDNLKENNQYVFTNMKELTEEEMKNLYSIDSTLTSTIIFKTTIDSNSVDTYIIVKGNEEINTQIEAYFETLKLQCDMYNALNASKVENRLEAKIGEYNIYIISSNNELVLDTIKNS